MPEFYRQLLGHYLAFREKHDATLRYTPGTSELIDWTQCLIYERVAGTDDFRAALDTVKKTACAVAKDSRDAAQLRKFLNDLAMSPA